MTQAAFTQIVKLAIVNRNGHQKLATSYLEIFNIMGGETAPVFGIAQTSCASVEYKRFCQEMAALHTAAIAKIDGMLHYLETNTDF